MKPVFSRDWQPQGAPRGAIALVHGLGEHSGRYERLAERFTDAGFAVWAIDLRGHGQSPGARGDIRFAPALEDIDALVARCGASGAGVPVFLYGHSLGALLSVLWLLERPAAPVAGAVDLGDRAAQRAARAGAEGARWRACSGEATPKARLKSGIDPETLSRDPEVVAAYRKDKLVHDIASFGFGRDALDGVDAILDRRAAARRAAARDPRQRGRARLRVSGAHELAALAPDVCTLQVYDGLFHEIHHEPEQAQVFADVLAWIEAAAG